METKQINQYCKIDKECDSCESNHSWLGCIDHGCLIFTEWDQGQKEMYLEEKDEDN